VLAFPKRANHLDDLVPCPARDLGVGVVVLSAANGLPFDLPLPQSCKGDLITDQLSFKRPSFNHQGIAPPTYFYDVSVYCVDKKNTGQASAQFRHQP
jgi:hypothetical protein